MASPWTCRPLTREKEPPTYSTVFTRAVACTAAPHCVRQKQQAASLRVCLTTLRPRDLDECIMARPHRSDSESDSDQSMPSRQNQRGRHPHACMH
eukprot:2733271-Rhodomonas_salina.1